MTYEDYTKYMWLSIYGSYLSSLIHNYLKSYDFVPNDKIDSFKEQAKQVADLAMQGIE